MSPEKLYLPPVGVVSIASSLVAGTVEVSYEDR